MEKVILDVSKWLEAQDLTQQSFVVEGIKFELLALDAELKAQLKEVDGYEEILEFAAEAGVSIGYCRAMDNEAHKDALTRLWDNPKLLIDEDPCIKLRVGEKVCEISGLTAYIEKVNEAEIEAELEAERLAEEEAKSIAINGDDKEPDFEVTMGELQEAAESPLNNI